MANERTYIMIKPDGVQRGLVNFLYFFISFLFWFPCQPYDGVHCYLHFRSKSFFFFVFLNKNFSKFSLFPF